MWIAAAPLFGTKCSQCLGICHVNWYFRAHQQLEEQTTARLQKGAQAIKHLKGNDVLLLGVTSSDLDGVLYCLRAAVAEEEAGQLLRTNFPQLVEQSHLE